MIDGVASEPFSAITLPPLEGRTNNRGKIVTVSRERYGKSKELVEEKIIRWTGVEEKNYEFMQKDGKPTKKPFSKPIYNNQSNRADNNFKKKAITPIKNLESVSIESKEDPISLREAFSRGSQKFSGRKGNVKKPFVRENRDQNNQFHKNRNQPYSIKQGQIVKLP